jgi:hypothetical protein
MESDVGLSKSGKEEEGGGRRRKEEEGGGGREPEKGLRSIRN